MCKEDKIIHDRIVCDESIPRASIWVASFWTLVYGMHIEVHMQGVAGIDKYIWSGGNNLVG